jgi:hypothetical protein
MKSKNSLFFFLLIIIFSISCSKQSLSPSIEARARGSVSLHEYADQTGTSPETLLKFNDSLWLQKKSPSKIENCLVYFADEKASRNKFLECLSKQGLFFYSKKVIEDLLPYRLYRLKNIHDPQNGSEYRKSLKLLNWIFDMALEQYHLSDPSSYWLEAQPDGTWKFREEKDEKHPEWTLKNRADYDFQDGDVSLSVSSDYFSAIIPQYTYPERRLTHMWVYRGQRDSNEGHVVEAIMGEGVWPTYKDSYRRRDKYYEQFVLRYNDRNKTESENLEIRKKAADFSESKIGSEYDFSGDNRKGYFCTFLASMSFANAFFNINHLEGEALFEKVSQLFPLGYSPLRQGLSRKFAAKFGVEEAKTTFPASGDFLTLDNFDTIAYYVRPDLTKTFNDTYYFAESLVNAIDKGATVNVPKDIDKIFVPLAENRDMLKGLIGYVRQVHSHSLFKNKILENKVSLKFLDEKDPQEFFDILERLDAERVALSEAAEADLSANLSLTTVFKNVPSVDDPSKTVRATTFFSEMKKNGSEKFRRKDFLQLRMFIDKLSVTDLLKMIRGRESQLPVLGTMARLTQSHFEAGKIDHKEYKKLETLLRNYSMLLLSVPTVKKKVSEFQLKIENKEMPEDAMKSLFKLTPYLASSLSEQTIKEFITLQGLGKGAVGGLQTLREKLRMEHVWQMPPWIQRDFYDYILSQKTKGVVVYPQ